MLWEKICILQNKTHQKKLQWNHMNQFVGLVINGATSKVDCGLKTHLRIYAPVLVKTRCFAHEEVFACRWWFKIAPKLLILDHFVNKVYEWVGISSNGQKKLNSLMMTIYNHWLFLYSIKFVGFLNVKYWRAFCIICQQLWMLLKCRMPINNIKLQPSGFNTSFILWWTCWWS